ncbi:MAG: penicillin acylase family protein [Spirochaetes bacterium]|nr:penicillin acylase family protein [Spirochaetota bacterium]
MNRKIIIAGVCIAAAAVCSLAVVLIYRHAWRTSYSDEFSASVGSRLVLKRDDAGIPMILAEAPADVYFALGYLHCQDRYELMEYLRAVAAGASGASAGADGPALDRLAGAIGFASRAAELARKTGEPYASFIAAYARGVNVARGRMARKDILPRDWKSEDIIAILLLKEWANAFLNNREAVFSFSRDADSAVLKEIIPPGAIHYYSESESDSAEVVRAVGVLVKKYIGPFDRGFAFYLPARQTVDRYPISAFSFDDALCQFPGWFPVHVHVGDRVIKGVTHAGLPFIFAGNNLDVAFYGFTAGVDVQDFITELVIQTGNGYQYLGAAGWREFNLITPEGVSGGGLHATPNGPVLNDVFGGGEYGSYVVTMRSIFFGNDYIESLFDIPFVRTVGEASARVRGVQSFPRVYLFASDISAVRAWSGMVPVRKRSDALFRQGLDSAWNGMIDLSAYREETEERLFAGSFFQGGAPSPAGEWAAMNAGGRERRLNYLLKKKKRFAAKDVGDILSDEYSSTAARFLPLLLEILGDNPVASARLTRIYFQNWKGSMKPDFIGPSLFHALLRQFMRETYGDELKDQTDRVMERWELLVPRFYEIVRENRSPLFDDVSTYTVESRETVFDRCFLKAMRMFNRTRGPDMNDWGWGEFHRGHFAVPGLRETFRDEPFSGGMDTLLLGSVEPSLRPNEVTSLSGFFGIEASSICMNFGLATDPRSEFYHGRVDRAGFTGFHELSPQHVTAISPAKK